METLDSIRRRIADVADDMLNGNTDLLEGCRMIVSQRSRLPEGNDGVFDVFVGVESELDDIPVGRARDIWTRESLALKDSQKEAYLARVADRLGDACKALRARYEGTAR